MKDLYISVVLLTAGAVAFSLEANTWYYTAEAKVVEPLVEVVWDEEQIKEKIDEVFPDAPVMREIARCESQFVADAENTTLNKDGSTDGGVFQLNSIHDAELERLGFDKWEPEDNIAFARILYERNGLRDWRGSRHCWNK